MIFKQFRDLEFWENLRPCSDAALIVDVCEQYFGRGNICILSSPSLDPACLSAKARWIKKYLPQYKNQYFLGPSKHFAASSDHLLIDDSDKNVNAFRAAGGKAILMCRQWNSGHAVKQPVKELQRCLKEEDWYADDSDDNDDLFSLELC